MPLQLSDEAKKILEAGINAARKAGGSGGLAEADRAVAEAVGNLCLIEPEKGEVAAIDSLIEIAQMHVREMLSEGKPAICA